MNNPIIDSKPNRFSSFALVFPSLLLLLLSLSSCQHPSNHPEEENWLSLFNGKDLTGWTIKFAGSPLDSNYLNTFRVRDSMLSVDYSNYDSFENKYAHIYYEQPYSYYKLKFEYRFTGHQVPGGESWNVRNSGVMVHSQSAESNGYDQHFPVSIEVQLLGGLGEGERTTGNLCTPGTAVVYQGEVDYTHCINSSSPTYHGNQWIAVEVLVKGGEEIIHIVEGDTVLRYTEPQVDKAFISATYEGEDWAAMGVAQPEEWMAKAGQILTEGYIALQAESHPIDFRNIQLLDLCGCMDAKAKNYKSYFIQSDPKSCLY